MGVPSLVREKREKRDEDFEVLCALYGNASYAMELQGVRSLGNAMSRRFREFRRNGSWLEGGPWSFVQGGIVVSVSG